MINSNDGFDNILIRGFTDSSLDAGRFRNGVRFPLGTGKSSLANIEQVEVLKGPAAVLYGRVEPGGIINLVTKKPLAEPYYSLEQEFGSYDFYQTTADATGPLNADRTLISASSRVSPADNRTVDRFIFNAPLSNRETTTVFADLTGDFHLLGMAHKVLLGVDYYASDSESDLFLDTAGLFPAPIDVFNPVYGQVDLVIPAPFFAFFATNPRRLRGSFGSRLDRYIMPQLRRTRLDSKAVGFVLHLRAGRQDEIR